MDKVKSGITILLNTKSNCTWIAEDYDEEIQTGSRENDKHIEIAGELTLSPFRWKEFKKEPPKLNTSVLAVDIRDGYMEVVDVQEIEGKLCICTNKGYSLFSFSDAKPTHWMPLPKLPSE